MVFDHWEIMPGDPLDENSMAGKMVTETRLRKGLSKEVPPLNKYLDKL
jgi:elongation factor 2